MFIFNHKKSLFNFKILNLLLPGHCYNKIYTSSYIHYNETPILFEIHLFFEQREALRRKQILKTFVSLDANLFFISYTLEYVYVLNNIISCNTLMTFFSFFYNCP